MGIGGHIHTAALVAAGGTGVIGRTDGWIDECVLVVGEQVHPF